MKCLHCGTDFADGIPSCPNCGAPASSYGQSSPRPGMQGRPYPQPGTQGQPYSQPYMQGQPYPQPGTQGQPYPQPGTQGQPYSQPYMQGQPYSGGMGYIPQQMTKKEFLHHPNLSRCKNSLTSAAILAYVSAAFTLIYRFLTDTGSFGIIDLLFLLLLVGLGLGIQLGQSRVCAIILAAYSIIGMISDLILYGRPSGYLVVIAAINAIIATFRFHKAWREYQRSGIVPVLKW